MWEGTTHKQKMFVRLSIKIQKLIDVPRTPYILQRCFLGIIPKRIATKILIQIGRRVYKFKYQLDKYALIHIIRKHLFTEDELTLLPCILHEPDEIRESIATKQGLQSIIFEKTIGCFLYTCVTELRLGTRLVAIKTFYKKRKTPC